MAGSRREELSPDNRVRTTRAVSPWSASGKRPAPTRHPRLPKIPLLDYVWHPPRIVPNVLRELGIKQDKRETRLPPARLATHSIKSTDPVDQDDG